MHARLLFCLVLSLLLCISVSLTSSADASANVCSSQWSPEDSQQQFVVRFQEYRQGSEWKIELERILGESSNQWRWIERENAASAFPTDFGVIRLSPLTLDMNKAKSNFDYLKLLTCDVLIGEAIEA